ncbi:MAG TPA: methyltransferase domain-containing protein [Gemmataceae bacterium]|nr:methyltransferase domain-containing protein [Gemmataceae bacterium]
MSAPADIPLMLRVEDRTAFPILACPKTGQPLWRLGDALVTPDRVRTYPIVREIPRFVSSDQYVRSFSFEWNVHDHTQLDRFRADDSSERIFRAKTGLTPADVRGKLVLDAGIGAGRFADVLARWGAVVVGVDLSYAVEAASVTFGEMPNVLVCQADIGHLPFRPGTFDFIVSIGVLHHTPDTRRYFEALPRLLKPGGEIAIWVYPDEGEYATRAKWIPFTSRIAKAWYHSFCKVFVPWALRRGNSRFVYHLRHLFPISDQGLGIENDVLDTFDAYSPRFHGVHSPAEVKDWFRAAGLTNIREYPWPTAVRGRRVA